jgi:hypothetical protein
MKFGQAISDAMQGEVVFHLSDQTSGIRAIKFVHLDSWKTQIMMKRVGLKLLGIGGHDILRGEKVDQMRNGFQKWVSFRGPWQQMNQFETQGGIQAG